MTPNTKMLLLAACMAGVMTTAPAGFAAQTTAASDTSKQRVMMRHPIRSHGQATTRLEADMLSVNISLAAVADSMDEIITKLRAHRDDMATKVGSGSLNVTRTDISSLRIYKQGGNQPNYRGEVQLTVEIAGFDDPLDAIAKIADEKVTRVGSLRYGFSDELLKDQKLCDMALEDARNRAAKIASSSGHELGKLIDSQCNDSHLRQRGYSSQSNRQVSVTATATFERAQ